MKKLLSIMLLVLVALAGQAQKVNTWNEVVIGFSNVRILKVTKVTLYADRTEVALHLDFRAGQWMSVAKETYLQAGDKQYQVKDATVIQLGERYTLPTDTMNFVLTFNPVPQDTKVLDYHNSLDIPLSDYVMLSALYIIIRYGTSPARP